MSESAKEDEQKTERFNMFMSPSEMKAIEDWAWEKRIRSKSEAVRRLCRIALIEENTRPSLNAAMKKLLDFVLLLGNQTLEERPRAPEEHDELRALASEIVPHVYDVYEKLVEQSVRMSGLADGAADLQEALDWEKRAADFLHGRSLFRSLQESPEALAVLNEAVERRKVTEKGDDD